MADGEVGESSSRGVVTSSRREVVESSRRRVVEPVDSEPVFSFDKLEVYQAARGLSRRLAKSARLLPAEERFRLRFQIEKARLSLTNAISEGHGRYTYKDRKHYCYEARGSLQELVDDIIECKDMRYAKAEHLADLKRDAFRVLQLIDGWARYLEKQRRTVEAVARLSKTKSPKRRNGPMT